MESAWRVGAGLWLVLFFCVVFAGVPTGSAAAPLPEELTQFGSWGSAAGQARSVTGIAADPTTGDLYVAESTFARVGEFTAWGEFVRAWGWGVRDGAAEFQICTAATGCQEALTGSGSGQFRWANGISVDPDTGDVYVFDLQNKRVQKFDSEGHFILMAGGDVDKTTGGNVCTVASGDECGAGVSGTGAGEFSMGGLDTYRNYISVAPGGTVYVGDHDRIQEFEPDGSFKAEIPLPYPGDPGALAVDPVSGDVYFAYNQGNRPRETPANIFRLNSSGGVVDELGAAKPIGLATDPQGNVYVLTQREFGFERPEVLEYGPGGETIIGPGSKFTSLPFPENERIPERAVATNPVTGAGGIDIYTAYTDGVSQQFLRIYGPPPDKWPPPAHAPEVDGQFASKVGLDSASVKALINPVFWADTTFRVEYGTQPCAAGGCTRVPASGETALGAGIVDNDVTTEPVELGGLSPGTTYHFRFTAQSGGGGPTVGPEGTFTTFKPPPPPNQSCPNQAFRTGPSATLAGCRAYEMVSPVDKEGGEVLGICNNTCFEASFDQAAESGDALTYSSYRAFPSSRSAPWASQYLARRGASGWVTESISPPQEGRLITSQGLDFQFKGFLADLSQGWFLTTSEPALTEDAVPGFANLYRRDSADGAYEALTKVTPPTSPTNYVLELQGFSADGSHVVFRADAPLTPDAASGTGLQLYDYTGGELHLVSVLPGNTPAPEASAGRGANALDGRSSSVFNAVSADGSRIYWSASKFGEGPLYVRVDGDKTFQVSAGPTFFRGAAADGSRAIYTEASKLYEYDLEDHASTLIATGVTGVMGMSADARRLYFASEEVLAAGAEAGRPNLYFREVGGGTKLVATLPAAEANAGGVGALSPVSEEPFARVSRVSADGLHAVFMSAGSLTGFDNTDALSGEADREVYLYDAADGDLHCISCNPTGIRPVGRALRIRNGPSKFWAAAQIPGWPSQLYPSRLMNADGSRVFFDSFEQLSPRDQNESQDVYEWERPGTGECTEADGSFQEVAGGCVNLVSSGSGPQESSLVDLGAEGRDVFFSTADSLVPQDPGLRDLYDAREGGGLPSPSGPAPECEGEACQPPAAAPSRPSPGTTAAGPGNPERRPPRCRKGKHRVKTRHGGHRCAKNAHHKSHRHHERKHQKRRAQGKGRGH